MVGNKAQKAVAAALTGVLAFGGVAPAFAGVWTGDANRSWYRINGDHRESYALGTYDDDDNFTNDNMSGNDIVRGENRYDTMWDAIHYNRGQYVGTKYVVLASGTSQADALVAAGVAGMLRQDLLNDANWQGPIDVPVIITPSDKLCTQAKNVITWLAERSAANKAEDFTVYLVGGEAALSKAVAKDVADIEVKLAGDTDDDNISVERLKGDDRVATSLEAAKVVDDDGWLDDDIATSQNWVFIANGKAWPDALSVSSSAYRFGRPILLTGADGKLSADQIEYLKKLDDTVRINVIGGPAQPSAQQLFDEGFTRTRVEYTAGNNRYETSAAVIEWSVDRGFAFNAIAVASGAEGHWADALIGGPFVGANGGVIALVDGVDEVTALKAAYKFVKDNGGAQDADGHYMAPLGSSYIMGGTAAVNKAFADKLNDNFPVV